MLRGRGRWRESSFWHYFNNIIASLDYKFNCSPNRLNYNYKCNSSFEKISIIIHRKIKSEYFDHTVGQLMVNQSSPSQVTPQIHILQKPTHTHKNTIQNPHMNPQLHIKKPTHTHTHTLTKYTLQNPHIHTYTYLNIRKPTHTNNYTLKNKKIHTPTHTQKHTLQNPHITKPIQTHTHTLQNPQKHTTTYKQT